MKHHIVSSIQNSTESFIMTVKTDNARINPVIALKNAAKEFSTTDEFENYMKKWNNTTYTWGDLLNSIPDEITQKHGVIITSVLNCEYVVNHDENLLD